MIITDNFPELIVQESQRSKVVYIYNDSPTRIRFCDDRKSLERTVDAREGMPVAPNSLFPMPIITNGPLWCVPDSGASKVDVQVYPLRSVGELTTAAALSIAAQGTQAQVKQ
jgi:hypothetical protein